MIKKFLNAFLMGALSLCVLGTVSSCTDYDDDISALSDRIDDLESSTSVSISSLSSQISSINSTISSLDSDLQGQIDDIIESLSGYATTSDLSSLQSTLTSQIEALQASLEDYVTEEELQSTLATLALNYYTKQEIDNIFVTAVSAIDPTVTDLQTAVSAIVSAISNATSANTALETAVTDLQDALDALEADTADKLNGKADYVDMVTTQNAIVAAQDAIAALEEDIAAINLNLQGYATAKEMETTIITIGTIQDDIEALQEQLEALEIDMADKLYGKADYIDMVTTQNAIIAIQESIESINSLLEGVEENVQDQIDAINESLEALRTVLGTEGNDWFGGDFETYVANLGFVQTDYIGNLGTSSVTGETYTTVKQYIDEYYESLAATVEAATTVDGVSVTEAVALNSDAIADLQEALSTLQTQVNELEERVLALEGRIQSIVYAPAYTDGKILFTAAQYVSGIDNTPVYLREAGDASYAYATFYVTPKALAESLCTSDWSVSLEKYVALTRAGEDEGDVIISNIYPGEVEGTIVLELESTYSHTDTEALMIALHVEKSSGDDLYGDEDNTYGSSYTTSFIQTGSVGDANVTENFVLVYTDEETGEYVEVADDWAGELAYTSAEAYEFFSGCEVVYKDSAYGLMTIDDAAYEYNWTAAVDWSYEVTAVASSSADYLIADTDYKLADDNTSFTLLEHTSDMVGQTLTATAAFYLMVDAATLTQSVDDVCTIIDEPIVAVVSTDPVINFTWNLATAITESPAYTYALTLKADDFTYATHTDGSSLTAAEIASIKAAMAAGTDDLEWTLISGVSAAELDDNEESMGVESATFGFSATSWAADETTGNITATLTLDGDISQAGTYYAIADFGTATSTIQIYLPIDITGAPEAVEVDLGTISIPYDPSYTATYYQVNSTYTNALADGATFISLAWAALGEDAQAQYGGVDAFTSYLKYSSETRASEAVILPEDGEEPYLRRGQNASTGTDSYLYINIDWSTVLYGETYSLESDLVGSWATNNTIAKYTADFILSVDNLAKLTIGDALNTATNTVTIEPKITGSNGEYSLSYEHNDLSLAVYYNGDDENYSVVYVVETADCDASVTDGILSWGTTYGEKSLDVTAYLYYGNYICDEVSFTCVLNDPLTGELLFNGGNGALSVYASTSKANTVNIFSYNNDVLLGGLYCTCENYVDEPVFGYGYTANPRLIFSTSLGAAVTYGDAQFAYDPALDSTDRVQVTNRIHWDAESTTLTVDQGQLELAVKVTVTIPVTFTYRFGEYTTNIVFEVTQE